MNCKICGSIAAAFGSAELLRRYPVTYYRCPDCGFVQTEEPYWLEEAYLRPINISDTGIMARNIYNATIVSAIIKICFNPDGKFIDYGGGYGIFVRMMRDRGFDFYRDDKYCDNLFASGFDVADSGTSHFELLTAFEVFEHFVSPSAELEKLLQKSDSILFTTEIIPDNPPQPAEWWYYALDHGQHISFYTRNSLQCMANKNGLNYFNRGNTHLFTRVKLSAIPLKFKLATHPRIARFLDMFLRKKPLNISDYKQITGMNITGV